jgi:predicted  nucleic acid-binding Zn-ribbon protein
VNADPAVQLRLLDLQAADTALAQLAHRRATLPELAALAEREKQAGDLHNETVEAQTRLGDIDAEQQRLEREVDTVRAREARDEQRLQAGGLPAKELEGLQHELATLKRRQGTLEDELLEVMERREDAAAAVTELRSRAEAMAAERADLEARRDTAFAEIDAHLEERTVERDRVAAELPADLLALYEKAREHGGGVGAAMLRQRRCEGCHIELAGSELTAARNAAPDAVLRCDNCRRILVRTAESGL